RLRGGVAQPALELAAERLEPAVHLAVAEPGERRQPRRDGERVARQRAGLVDRAKRRDVIHQAPRSTVGANRESAADDLAEAREVGLNAVELLGAAVGDAEARDHLVEDQDGVVRLRELAKPFEEPGTRR